ncbi:hypothetical protein [Deinococcus peraridilitoris]|uniref:Uncharacterized protein n=1 Tax=Deinococcus peraridilitoris (strain DSM 19664 / LMG 22246 / CIP 109416 / KR-200) TaxID=937777 RepID=L0A3E2_DEIPD|nr:hypothetical protein [Deinococcus peraridilitoris]AFZ67959.1 hypothetical protein Deipe_2488 [Deinococcus peraridilitoris DSM 19664]
MSQLPDLNEIMRQVIDLARQARRLARAGHNEVAARSAEHFEQGAATAYRNQNREQLENNLAAVRALVDQLRARLPGA